MSVSFLINKLLLNENDFKSKSTRDMINSGLNCTVRPKYCQKKVHHKVYDIICLQPHDETSVKFFYLAFYIHLKSMLKM